MKIMESAENYLETILVLSKRKPHVRSRDIATELSFSKPSVSVAMKISVKTAMYSWILTDTSHSPMPAVKLPKKFMSAIRFLPTGCSTLVSVRRLLKRMPAVSST